MNSQSIANCNSPVASKAITVKYRDHRIIKCKKKLSADALENFSDKDEKTGIKAEDKAPSPKSLRNRLGIVKPMINAELKALAPIAAKNTTSRIKPVIRDKTVVILTEAIFFIYCFTKPNS